MFSDWTLSRFDAPRPPTPITARLSLSLRLRPRKIAGAANAPAAEPTRARPNWRRVDRVEADSAGLEVSLMGFLAVGGGISRRPGASLPQRLRMDRMGSRCKPPSVSAGATRLFRRPRWT